MAPVAPAPPLPTRETSLFVAPAAAASEFEVHEVGARARQSGATAAPSSFAARLATPQSLRDAIVLREIFGPPRSMQPFN